MRLAVGGNNFQISMKLFLFDAIIAVSFIHSLCCCAQERCWQAALPENYQDTIAAANFGIRPFSTYRLSTDIDLKGCVCVIPENVNIVLAGGYFKNGALIGQETQIIGSMVAFDRVRLKGTWRVKKISTDMFRTLDYVNALADVLALASPNEKNEVLIEEGAYALSASTEGENCLSIPCRTKLVVDGEIVVLPNDLQEYAALYVEGQHVTLSGKGRITGDKDRHRGKKGEWGHGIKMWNVHNVTLTGLTVSDCWGDCLYIGGESSQVKVFDCIFDNGRRQGISITGGEHVKIWNCVIRNVGGTAPEYGIDMEPNDGNTVRDIYIRNTQIEKCRGGIMAYGKARNAYVGDILVKNCNISDTHWHPFAFTAADGVSVSGCKVKWNANYNLVLNRESRVFEKNNRRIK